MYHCRQKNIAVAKIEGVRVSGGRDYVCWRQFWEGFRPWEDKVADIDQQSGTQDSSRSSSQSVSSLPAVQVGGVHAVAQATFSGMASRNLGSSLAMLAPRDGTLPLCGGRSFPFLSRPIPTMAPIMAPPLSRTPAALPLPCRSPVPLCLHLHRPWTGRRSQQPTPQRSAQLWIGSTGSKGDWYGNRQDQKEKGPC